MHTNAQTQTDTYKHTHTHTHTNIQTQTDTYTHSDITVCYAVTSLYLHMIHTQCYHGNVLSTDSRITLLHIVP